ncbi:MAG: phage integrase family protein [Mycobacterium sp.]|nr:phage integrase family protein [Mycobacterium sp.]
MGEIVGAAAIWFRPLIGLCAFAGLRLGEAAAVQLDDIDFLRRTLTISRQVQRKRGGGIEFRAPKYCSERVVFVPDGLVTMLAGHVEHIGVRPDGWLFAGAGPGPPHKNTVFYWWRKTLNDAGLSGITMHDLRHSYASGLIAQGCDVVTVQRSLGHSMATTTLDTYSHRWPTAEDRTRKAADAMMNTALGNSADSVRTEAT